MTAPPPCAGQWELFDSTDELDHIKAKSLCAECPMLADCYQRLETARNRAHRGGGKIYGPSGTWAGRLIGAPRTSAERIAAEERMFSPDELRAGHAAWAAGVRTDRVIAAERIYQRQRSRRRYREQKEAAA